MATQNIPTVSCPCPGTLTFQPSLDAQGTSTISDDAAWANLTTNMPSGLDILNFFVAVGAAVPAACPGDCGAPTVTQTLGPTGYSGSATKDAAGITTWTYQWTCVLNVTITCTHPKKELILTRPKLTVVEKAPTPDK